MSLNLDARQCAMLLEMGIRVWQPQPPLAAPASEARAAPDTADDEPEPRRDSRAPAAPVAARPAIEPPALAPRSPALRPASVPVAPGARPAPADAQPGWHLGAAQRLYADTAQAGGARWLVLAQAPAGALPEPVFQDDAGQLLDNMLRAARLERAGAVLLAPLVRQGASAPAPDFVAALADLVAQSRPDVVLVMGRLAALALVPGGEPFGRLRGRVHALYGASTIVTYDASYLLRTPDDKAKAWADLCLAMHVAAAGGPARRAS